MVKFASLVGSAVWLAAKIALLMLALSGSVSQFIYQNF